MIKNNNIWKKNFVHRYSRNNMYKGLTIHASVGLHEKINNLLHIYLKKKKRVLDIGAGCGALSLRLKDSGYDVEAVDILKKNFKIFKKIPFKVADLNNNFSNLFKKKFDCIVAVEIIEHLENPWHFFKECRKSLKPGGIFVLTTPNIHNSVSKYLFFRHNHHQWFNDYDIINHGHITALSYNMIKHCASKSGFTVLKMLSHGNIFDSKKISNLMKLSSFITGFFSKTSTELNGEILIVIMEKS